MSFTRSMFTSIRGLSQGGVPIKQTARKYTTAGPTSSNKNIFLYSAAAGVAAGVTYYFGFKDTAAASLVKKELPPAIPTFTGDNTWVGLKLIEIEAVTPDTKRFRFALPEENSVSGLKIASALLTKYKGPNDAKPTLRPYTPVSDEDDRGYLDLLVKRYENGPMSEHFHSMEINQRLDFKGPLPKYEWTPNKHEHIALIAGGTGITPMYQLIRAIFKNPEDKTKVTLVYGNRSENDIILKKELERLENTYPQRFKAFYVLDKKPADSNWAVEGYVNKELLKTVLPEPKSTNLKIFVCGPPGMYKAISGNKISPKDQGEVEGILKELGYTKEEVYKF
ncbi:hypothetical protein DFH27DRAFT_327571 [Peziza echinospora]|nr:hypothetical protein DFH27DRAFT_327571 [Peziza echinospora]